MPDYRFYIVNKDGHIAEPATTHELPNDEAAVQEAKALLDGRIIEIWQGTRVVYRLDPKKRA
jgi:hypothetical protein